jgi:hypothetical protein
MADYPVGSRKNDFITPPRAFASAGDPGQCAVLAVSASAITIDLTQGISQATTNLSQAGQKTKSPTQNCLTIEADVDIGIIFGRTSAAVSSGNAPVIANNGTLSGATYVGTAGTCFIIKAASSGQQPIRFLLQPGVDNFLGVVGSGAGKVRFYQSSPDDA